MSQNAFSTIAMLAALTFLAMALSGCAGSERFAATAPGPGNIAPIDEPAGLPEFHGAQIGADSLRGELPSEN
jgi:hypothetical protein